MVANASGMGALPVWVQVSHLEPSGPGLMVLACIVCSCKIELGSAGVKDRSMRSKHSGRCRLLHKMRHCIGLATLSKDETQEKGRYQKKQKTHHQHSRYGPAKQA